MKKLKIWLKIDIFGELALRHVNLLFQKTTADDECRGYMYNYCMQFLCNNCTIILDVVSCAIVARNFCMQHTAIADIPTCLLHATIVHKTWYSLILIQGEVS